MACRYWWLQNLSAFHSRERCLLRCPSMSCSSSPSALQCCFPRSCCTCRNYCCRNRLDASKIQAEQAISAPSSPLRVRLEILQTGGRYLVNESALRQVCTE